MAGLIEHKPKLVESYWQTGLVHALRMRVDYSALASGLFDLFNEDEVLMLRLTGMLPALKMTVLQRRLKEMLLERWNQSAGRHGEEAVLIAYVNRAEGPGFDVIEFRLQDLVREIVHEVVLAIYRLADLLV